MVVEAGGGPNSDNIFLVSHRVSVGSRIRSRYPLPVVKGD